MASLFLRFISQLNRTTWSFRLLQSLQVTPVYVSWVIPRVHETGLCTFPCRCRSYLSIWYAGTAPSWSLACWLAPYQLRSPAPAELHFAVSIAARQLKKVVRFDFAPLRFPSDNHFKSSIPFSQANQFRLIPLPAPTPVCFLEITCLLSKA